MLCFTSYSVANQSDPEHSTSSSNERSVPLQSVPVCKDDTPQSCKFLKHACSDLYENGFDI
jgi:hypothetical protein